MQIECKLVNYPNEHTGTYTIQNARETLKDPGDDNAIFRTPEPACVTQPLS
jgi:hypothetical protein